MSTPNSSEAPRVGVFVCHCGLNIAGTVDVKAVADYARSLPDVVFVKENRYTCADPGQEEIRKAIRQNNLNRVVIAACSPRMHEPTFRRTVSEAGLNPYLYEMANIREFASWCHQANPAAATERAKETVRMAVAKVRLLQPLKTLEVPVTNKALIVGGGIAGINAALDLAEQGFKVYMLENTQSIGGHMAALDKNFPHPRLQHMHRRPKMVDCARHPNITIFANSDLLRVDGYVGNFRVKIRQKPPLRSS
jgi:heterodisulfide reductase subunit A